MDSSTTSRGSSRWNIRSSLSGSSIWKWKGPSADQELKREGRGERGDFSSSSAASASSASKKYFCNVFGFYITCSLLHRLFHVRYFCFASRDAVVHAGVVARAQARRLRGIRG